MGAQLDSDKHALDNLRKSIQGSNAELQQWTEENAKAQKQALQHAKEFLVQSLFGAIIENREAKLDQVVRDMGRGDRMGTTIGSKLSKARAFEDSYKRLSVLIAALETAEYPGMDIESIWADFKERTAAIGKEGQVLAASWDLLMADPDARRAFREHGFEFAANSLKQALNLPIVGQGLDLGQFLLVDYGYDYAEWQVSWNRMAKNIWLDDKNLYAECLLSRQMMITFRDYNICRGKMPKLDGARPEDTKCEDHTLK